jgi:hypothetical protein
LRIAPAVLRIAAAVVLLLLGAVAVVLPEETSAQEIDFGNVDKFESLASGTLRVGATENYCG